MKVSEIVKITKKIRKMEKLKSRLLSTQEGNILKRNQLKRMRKTNPSVFKETWRDKQIRLKQEEQQKLDHATVRRGSFSWKDGEVIN